MPETAPSISSLTAICLREFLALTELSSNIADAEFGADLQDELGRLRVWIGNLGAHRKQNDRLSLDHRLREAPGLHGEVRTHLTALIEAVQDGIGPDHMCDAFLICNSNYSCVWDQNLG